MRVAFVTADDDAVRAEDTDRPHHDAACARRGIVLEHVPWDHQAAAWEAYDLVVLRSPWDYCHRLGPFLAWLDRVGGLPTLRNPAELVRWNLDKRYLADLARRGVPVVPTTVVGHAAEVPAAAAATGAAEVVVKPVVSAGSRLTGRFPAGHPGIAELARAIGAEGLATLVQPCVPSVAEAGEVSVVLVAGEVSHALRKGPILAPGGGFLGGAYQEVVEPLPATGPAVALARSVLGAVAEEGRARGWASAGRAPLYARVDVVELAGGSLALLEAELFEPSLFLEHAPPAADRFADAVAAEVAAGGGAPARAAGP